VVELAQSQGTLAAPEARPWLLRVSYPRKPPA
jgi:hypothetical protein